ncbi:MAG: hypothetical protein KJ737_12210 [Proteobacteria bacterium]|nr:hypothetical protein [Pseudomonadota bacterium]
MLDTNNFESKDIAIDGLDVTKHVSRLESFRKKGWFVFRSSPDPQAMNFRYSLKRPIETANANLKHHK